MAKRQVLSKGVFAAAAASGMLAMAGGYAHAHTASYDETTNASGSMSGHNAPSPVQVPVNVCGNTVDVVGAFNPAVGNDCANIASNSVPETDHSEMGYPGMGDPDKGYPGMAESGIGDSGMGHSGEGHPAMADSGMGHSGVGGSGMGGSGGDGSGDGYQGEEPCDEEEKPPVGKPPVDKPPVDKPPAGKPPVDVPPSGGPAEEPRGKPPVEVLPAADGPSATVPVVADRPATDEGAVLAETGAGEVGIAGALGALLIGGGALVFRRTRARARAAQV
ncbi:chaplin family protein [Streptomyces flavidovirens]|uniref:chaplin n=1 Tax=Streptomyces flavidovirens TaxID=67298 RepID=UPI0036CE3D2C